MKFVGVFCFETELAELAWLKRILGLLTLLSWLVWAGSFVVSAWIENDALDEPRIAEGIYQYPYKAKGDVYFLTHEQWQIVRISDATRNGSFIVVAILAIISSERRLRARRREPRES